MTQMTLTREEKLKAKAIEVREALTQWARAEGILSVGERIVFSLEIEEILIVVPKGGSSSVLDMSVNGFFTPGRLESAGAKPHMTSRIIGAFGRTPIGGEASMREFRRRYPTRRQLGKITGLGEGSVELVARVIREANIPFE